MENVSANISGLFCSLWVRTHTTFFTSSLNIHCNIITQCVVCQVLKPSNSFFQSHLLLSSRNEASYQWRSWSSPQQPLPTTKDGSATCSMSNAHLGCPLTSIPSSPASTKSGASHAPSTGSCIPSVAPEQAPARAFFPQLRDIPVPPAPWLTPITQLCGPVPAAAPIQHPIAQAMQGRGARCLLMCCPWRRRGISHDDRRHQNTRHYTTYV